MKIFALVLNYLFLLLMVFCVITFILLATPAGYLFALVLSFIGFGVWKQSAWAYFSAAAFGLACFQLAKQDYQFQTLKREAMIIGFCVIPVAVFLHEILARKKPQKPIDTE